MHPCTCIHMLTHAYTMTCIHLTWQCVHRYIQMHTHAYIVHAFILHAYTGIYICKHTCIHRHTYASTHAYICLHVRTHGYTCIHNSIIKHQQTSANISKHQKERTAAAPTTGKNHHHQHQQPCQAAAFAPFYRAYARVKKKKNKTQNQDPGTKTGPRGNNGSSQTAHFYLFGMVHIAIATSAGNDVNGSSQTAHFIFLAWFI